MVIPFWKMASSAFRSCHREDFAIGGDNYRNTVSEESCWNTVKEVESMFCKKWRVLFVALFVVGMSIGLGGSILAAEENTTLTVGITADPRGLSPVFACTYHDWVVGYRLYSSLFQADENFNPVPDLAESWEVSGDGLTYTFHLKRNATFHDGSPITSEDVEFSIMEVNLPLGSVCQRGPKTVIESVDTPDPHTIVFHLSAALPEFLNPHDGLGPHCSGILKKELYEGTDLLTNPYNFDPVGSGPYKFVEWVRGSHIVLDRYEGYHGELPAIERIVFRVFGDPIARALAFEKGEVDWVPFEMPASEVGSLNDLPGNSVFFHATPCADVPMLAFNMLNEPFNDKTVRKAVTAAIDKQKIVDLVYYGGAVAGTGFVGLTPFSAAWHNADAKQIEYDPELAAALLDQAGYPVKEDGWRFHFTLKYSTAYNEHVKMAELVKDDLKKIKVDAKIVSLDHAAWHAQVFENWDFDGSFIAYCTGPNPTTLKRLHTENIQPISWANCINFSNSEYDALFGLMISETDVEKRLRFTDRMQEILTEEQPAVYTVLRLNGTGIKEGLFTEEPKNVWIFGYLWMHLDRIKLAH